MPLWTVRLLGGEEMTCRRRVQPDLPDIIWPVLGGLLSSPYGRLPRSRLAGMLWPDRDEQSARHCLATALWRIRSRLGGGRSPISLGEESVALQLSNLWVDSLAFRRRAEGALANPAALVHPGARRRLERALSLYRGPLLGDRPHEWIAIERERMRALYIDAHYALASAEVGAGRWDRVRDSALRICETEPFREDAQRLLMLALVHCGNRALALSQYRELEKLLDAELGIAPMDETSELAREIAAGRASPDPPRQRFMAIATGLVLGVDQREAVRRVRDHLSSSIELIDESILD